MYKQLYVEIQILCKGGTQDKYIYRNSIFQIIWGRKDGQPMLYQNLGYHQILVVLIRLITQIYQLTLRYKTKSLKNTHSNTLSKTRKQTSSDIVLEYVTGRIRKVLITGLLKNRTLLNKKTQVATCVDNIIIFTNTSSI